MSLGRHQEGCALHAPARARKTFDIKCFLGPLIFRSKPRSLIPSSIYPSPGHPERCPNPMPSGKTQPTITAFTSSSAMVPTNLRSRAGGTSDSSRQQVWARRHARHNLSHQHNTNQSRLLRLRSQHAPYLRGSRLHHNTNQSRLLRLCSQHAPYSCVEFTVLDLTSTTCGSRVRFNVHGSTGTPVFLVCSVLAYVTQTFDDRSEQTHGQRAKSNMCGT